MSFSSNWNINPRTAHAACTEVSELNLAAAAAGPFRTIGNLESRFTEGLFDPIVFRTTRFRRRLKPRLIWGVRPKDVTTAAYVFYLSNATANVHRPTQ